MRDKDGKTSLDRVSHPRDKNFDPTVNPAPIVELRSARATLSSAVVGESRDKKPGRVRQDWVGLWIGDPHPC